MAAKTDDHASTAAQDSGAWLTAHVRSDEDEQRTEPNVAEMGLILERAVTAVQEGATTARSHLVKDGQDFVCIVVPGRLAEDVTYEVRRVEG